uniref:Carboxylic ester hydrolase n=1 Tax=Scolopendra viridis TaxID=118503 RepID=A0A4D5R9U4_SCOVI
MATPEFAMLTFILCFSLTLGVSTNDVIVHLNNGAVRGEEMTGENGNVFYSFRGIPYAEPPVGNLRFKTPVPKRPWTHVINATQDGPPCSQVNFFTLQYAGSEDCLYLNVYTPKLPSSDSDVKLDVVFHIHGGGFLAFDGGSVLFGPRRFPLENVVLVSLTYRVGALGFLSTKDSAAPGNFGLLDQTEALRWVRNNIHKFGGDSNRVTLLGQSAGAASVLYQMLSPLAEGLFHRAIVTSGSVLCPWAFQRDPVYWTKKLAQDVNCSIQDSEELVACLRQKSAKELITKGLSSIRGTPVLSFTPTVDNYFLHDTPYNVIRQNKYNREVPLMMGTTKDEGNTWYLGRQNTEQDFTDDEILDVLKSAVEVRRNVDDKVRKIKKKYFPSINSYKDDDVQKELGKTLTHGMFHKCIFRTVKAMTESGTKVHFFMYDYEAPFSQSELFNKPPTYGVCHGDDLYSLFEGFMFQIKNLDDVSKNVKLHYQKLIINFVQHGNPVLEKADDEECEWPQAQPNELFRYHVDKECSVDKYDETEDDLYNFWIKEIYETEEKTTRNFRDEL